MKPENTFISAIHKKIPNVWHEKMCNPYRRGMPDVWYSGVLGDLWVEYKWYPRVPYDTINMDLSPHQQLWINERSSEGRNVWVSIGAADRRVYTLSNLGNVHLKRPAINFFVSQSREEFARSILRTVGERHCLTKLAGGSRTF